LFFQLTEAFKASETLKIRFINYESECVRNWFLGVTTMKSKKLVFLFELSRAVLFILLAIRREKSKMSKRKISENYEKIIERVAVAKHEEIKKKKAAKQKDTKIKEKSLGKATEFIVEKLHKEFAIYKTILNNPQFMSHYF